MGRPKKVKTEIKKNTEAVKIATTEPVMRGKEQNKNIRPPIGEEKDINKLSKADKIRMATGKQLRLDVSFYSRLPEYENMTLFLEEDRNGAVERWLHIGASLVPRRSKSLVSFKGFTDRPESEWACFPVGSDEAGNTLMNFLMFMPKEEYYALRIAPKEARNKEILEALGHGRVAEGERVMPGVSGIRTYAPNNPSGTGKGFEQSHEA